VLSLPLSLSKSNSSYKYAHSFLAKIEWELNKNIDQSTLTEWKILSEPKPILSPFTMFWIYPGHLQILMNALWAILVEMEPARMWLEVLNAPVRRDLSLVQWWHVKVNILNTEQLVTCINHWNSWLQFLILTTIQGIFIYKINWGLMGYFIVSSLCGLLCTESIKERQRWLMAQATLCITQNSYWCVSTTYIWVQVQSYFLPSIFFSISYSFSLFPMFSIFFFSFSLLFVDTSTHTDN
jgi:hypothetical protein